MSVFKVNTRIFFGPEGSNEATGVLYSEGIKKVLFFVDEHICNSEKFIELTELYDKAGIEITQIKKFIITSEPTYDFVDETTKSVRDTKADAIVAIGGGSLMDIAKSVAILLKNPGNAINYRGMNRVEIPGLPVICYPTTAGTGSEVTHTASLIDSASRKKLGINGKNITPHMAVLLPEFTFTCPKSVTIASGLDAMIHAIEAVTAKSASKITKMIGKEAFALLYTNFPVVLKDPENYEARENMLLGSYYAGIAMLNAGGGPASGISYPLGTYFKVPHGIAGGIFLPHVVEYNVKNGCLEYAGIYDLLPDTDLSLSKEEKSAEFAKKIVLFYEEIGAPTNLSAYDVSVKDIEFLTRLTIDQRMENLNLNPVFIAEEGTKEIISKVVADE